jgi:type IV pilus assembly protein PilE
MMSRMKKQAGFSLIELMIVIVIVAILASIAIPSYREAVRRSDRRAAQSVMMDIANRQHQLFVGNRAFAQNWAALGYALPPEVSEKYDPAITPVAGPPPGFTITFTAKGPQVADGNLSLTSAGVKTPADKW